MRSLINKNIDDYCCSIDETVIYSRYFLVEKAKGSFIWFKDIKEKYIDSIMGYSSTNFGHTNEELSSYVIRAVKKFDNFPTFNSLAKVELSKKLVNLLPNKISAQVYFPVGGAKAIDVAIKLARAYTKKQKILAFSNSFHGYSYAAMSVTDANFINKNQYFSDRLHEIVFFDFPDKNEINGKRKAIVVLEKISNYLKHNNNVAAVIFEPMQGANGFIIPPDNFLQKLTNLCKKHNVLSVCDEIQTGVCRTGHFYYHQYHNISPDIVLLGKSLAGGYYPLSAVIARKEIYNAISPSKSAFGSTFSNNLLGIEVANNVIKYIEKNGILDRVKKYGKYFFDQLNTLKNFEFIKNIHGVGLAASFDIDVPGKKIEYSTNIAKEIKKEAFNQKLIIQTAGIYGNKIKLTPSLLVEKEEIQLIIKKLKTTFEKINKILK